MKSIYNLYQEVSRFGNLPAEYVEKQLHPIPKTTSVNRLEYILRQSKDKIVLEIGASGQTPELIKRLAKKYYGIDISSNPGIDNYFQIDLDNTDELPKIEGLEIIIAGEIIEHLSNAGHFLDLLRPYNIPVVLTTPNANSLGSFDLLRQGIENVNKEHVCWYSYHTLKVLVERHNFKITEWFWYNGQPIFAEGLIFKMEPIWQ